MTIKNYVTHLEKKSTIDKETGCWNYNNATHVQGYGFARHYGTMKTVQRIMAIESNVFGNIDADARITNSCSNKLCCNPDHLIKQTQREVLLARYQRLGTGGKFHGKEDEIRTEYNKMKENLIPRTINIMAEKYGVHTSLVYRTIQRANKRDEND